MSIVLLSSHDTLNVEVLRCFGACTHGHLQCEGTWLREVGFGCEELRRLRIAVLRRSVLD